ncbi:MAG: hypothetical protein WC736_15920 [Gallionella sp.]|jgi:hypothetical protein
MRKILILLAVIAAVMSTTAIAAMIDYDRSVTYTDGSAIPAAKIPTIQYQGYSGPAPTGPWTPAGLVVDNLAISAPDPAPGATLWYTVDASLDGMTSAKAPAVSKSLPFLRPAGPGLRGVR